MVNWSGMTIITKRAVAVWFTKLLLKLNHARALVCRECGAEVLPEAIMEFVTDGCPCGGRKLEFRH